jgi:hypothetical protein
MGQNEKLNVEYKHVPRLEAGSAESLTYLEEEGYVVIANVLSLAQSKTALTKLWDYLEALGTGINRLDANTWDDDRWPTAVHGGILPGFGIGQTDAQWYIRDMPKVKQAFASIWNTDDLLVSFDGVSLWRPWHLNDSWKTNVGGSWLHIDQHPIGRPGRQCVQGLVNLLPTSEATGGNVIVPGSHKMFSSIPQTHTERLGKIPQEIDHFRFTRDDPIFQDHELITCHMEAGDLLLWDSRTVHCSNSADDTGQNADLLRAISLICMMPRSMSNPDVISRRKAAVKKRTSTTNWSNVFVNADQFPEVAQTPNKEKYQLPPIPELNQTQLRMVGWTESEIAQLI